VTQAAVPIFTVHPVVPTGNGNHGQAVIRIQDNGLNGKRKKPPPVHDGGEIRSIIVRDLFHRFGS